MVKAKTVHYYSNGSTANLKYILALIFYTGINSWLQYLNCTAVANTLSILKDCNKQTSRNRGGMKGMCNEL